MSENAAHVTLCKHTVVLVYPMKVYGHRGIDPLILKLSCMEGEYSVPFPCHQMPVE
jgi:hypothetical protein